MINQTCVSIKSNKERNQIENIKSKIYGSYSSDN